MNFTYLKSCQPRIRVWITVFTVLILISFITRLSLLVKAWDVLEITPGNLAGIFIIGLLYDIANAIYATLPLTIYLWLLPQRFYSKVWHGYVIASIQFTYFAILLFNGAAEWLFWDEFNSRFNFIAVDYLVYTGEVIGNIQQSYPVAAILTFVIIGSLAFTWILRARNDHDVLPLRKRSVYLAVYAIVFIGLFFGMTQRYQRFSKNAFANELAGNGMYDLFAAYLNNELDYDNFYKRIDEQEAFNRVQQQFGINPSRSNADGPHSLRRMVTGNGPEKKLNVVLISVESLSAKFMKLFGNTHNITPYLDSISEHSLVFTNLYATGTRTVRGLEALSLCIPPTPGQSIVRRPHNEGLFSLGQVFRDKGYACQFLYGGYGYFDNMNYFFSNNAYEVVDRTALSNSEIHHENIWGVADEDLFTLAERQIDQLSGSRPVFMHIMTTSNHRPFTYPDGRIDIPSHTGRNGAVKYTDYAIGKFIKDASRKNWFQNTIFIIVADHCASSAGKTDLPVNKYHIPLIMYSPSHIRADKMPRLMSQIDIGPTLLGMLNFSYESKFFGYDMFKLEPGRERAFISTYQNLGYLKNGKIVVLSPRQKVEAFELSDKLEPGKQIQDEQLIKEAIAWYQTASYSFKEGLLKQDERKISLK
jgi:phosphoglycerol transferase MdoB-like AlkP superfamily enzyme